jgi:Skp family chaperone for outer membrane proteins
MNIEAKDGKGVMPQFKKFVSEADVEESKRKRQEEWEKVRQPNQPIEAPPEQTEDMRCLYDRLQEQKDIKQAEHDDKYLLKNQVRGLDDEEARFLDTVSQRQEELMKSQEKEENELLTEYRTAVANQVTVGLDKHATSHSSAKSTLPGAKMEQKHRISQSQLLSGAVKRKRTSSVSDENENGKAARTGGIVEGSEENENDERSRGGVMVSMESGRSVATVVAVLPGIGVYTDSDDTDSSSDSEIDTDMFKRAKACSDANTR